VDEAQLREHIRQGESLYQELKESDAHTDDIAAALVAFANTEGGRILFGVADSGDIVGVPNPNRLTQRIDQIAYNNCEPPITVMQEIVPTTNGTVVVVQVPKGDLRPYRTARGDFFVRTSSGRRRASRQELLRLFQEAESLHYDEKPVLQSSLTDLDTLGFQRFFEHAYGYSLTDEQLTPTMQNMRLITPYHGQLTPTVAGILCFGRNPQRFLPTALVNAARIAGDQLANEPLDVKVIDGTLFDMTEDTMRFLKIHLPTPHRIVGLEPERRPAIPEEALRELLVNALVHRDYTIPAPIRVLMFDDRLEIHTPGHLPNTVTIESILLGASHVLRNPTLYILFYRSGLVTHLGSGVLRAKQAIEKVGKTLTLAQTNGEFIATIHWNPPLRGTI
jgi:ATP-dependent DNA helicase RecG